MSHLSRPAKRRRLNQSQSHTGVPVTLPVRVPVRQRVESQSQSRSLAVGAIEEDNIGLQRRFCWYRLSFDAIEHILQFLILKISWDPSSSSSSSCGGGRGRPVEEGSSNGDGNDDDATDDEEVEANFKNGGGGVEVVGSDDVDLLRTFFGYRRGQEECNRRGKGMRIRTRPRPPPRCLYRHVCLLMKMGRPPPPVRQMDLISLLVRVPIHWIQSLSFEIRGVEDTIDNKAKAVVWEQMLLTLKRPVERVLREGIQGRSQLVRDGLMKLRLNFSFQSLEFARDVVTYSLRRWLFGLWEAVRCQVEIWKKPQSGNEGTQSQRQRQDSHQCVWKKEKTETCFADVICIVSFPVEPILPLPIERLSLSLQYYIERFLGKEDCLPILSIDDVKMDDSSEVVVNKNLVPQYAEESARTEWDKHLSALRHGLSGDLCRSEDFLSSEGLTIQPYLSFDKVWKILSLGRDSQLARGVVVLSSVPELKAFLHEQRAGSSWLVHFPMSPIEAQFFLRGLRNVGFDSDWAEIFSGESKAVLPSRSADDLRNFAADLVGGKFMESPFAPFVSVIFFDSRTSRTDRISSDLCATSCVSSWSRSRCVVGSPRSFYRTPLASPRPVIHWLEQPGHPLTLEGDFLQGVAVKYNAELNVIVVCAGTGPNPPPNPRFLVAYFLDPPEEDRNEDRASQKRSYHRQKLTWPNSMVTDFRFVYPQPGFGHDTLQGSHRLVAVTETCEVMEWEFRGSGKTREYCETGNIFLQKTRQGLGLGRWIEVLRPDPKTRLQCAVVGFGGGCLAVVSVRSGTGIINRTAREVDDDRHACGFGLRVFTGGGIDEIIRCPFRDLQIYCLSQQGTQIGRVHVVLLESMTVEFEVKVGEEYVPEERVVYTIRQLQRVYLSPAGNFAVQQISIRKVPDTSRERLLLAGIDRFGQVILCLLKPSGRVVSRRWVRDSWIDDTFERFPLRYLSFPPAGATLPIMKDFEETKPETVVGIDIEAGLLHFGVGQCSAVFPFSCTAHRIHLKRPRFIAVHEHTVLKQRLQDGILVVSTLGRSVFLYDVFHSSATANGRLLQEFVLDNTFQAKFLRKDLFACLSDDTSMGRLHLFFKG